MLITHFEVIALNN